MEENETITNFARGRSLGEFMLTAKCEKCKIKQMAMLKNIDEWRCPKCGGEWIRKDESGQ